MRCHICNRVLDDPQLNADHKDIDPCHTCLQVIEDTLAGFSDLPAAQEEPGIDPILEGLFPESYDPFGADAEPG